MFWWRTEEDGALGVGDAVILIRFAAFTLGFPEVDALRLLPLRSWVPARLGLSSPLVVKEKT
jgi:hypothetical protein